MLRAKVSVFVDLWIKTQQLQAQSEMVRERETQWRALTEAVDEATVLLRSSDPDGRDRAVTLLEQARWG
ncbi:hypothetical protein Phou_035170 [Phytohabitans houttuyneae]|uniref:Uncharacterized protein n=1 Tax=Phytohabitans houttuyneae TaxID=1076126 RepID=A0A6V8KC79_9ACTN|nr:hypothetical protein Phou_035170 [Phytohabitans houttuyneae]